jgi:hypothetical protein
MSASDASSETRGSGAINDIVEVSREWAHKLLRRETWYKLNMSLGLKRLQELIVVGWAVVCRPVVCWQRCSYVPLTVGHFD